MSDGCRGIKSLLTAVIVASILTVPALNSMPSGAPGLYLTVAPIGLVGEGVKGAYTAVQVSLTTPDGPMKTVYAGGLTDSTVFIPYGRIEGVVSSWVRENNDTFPAIVVDCWVISEDGRLLASGTGTVTYDPLKLMRVKTMHARVTVVVTPPREGSLKPLRGQRVRSEVPEPLTWYEWRRVLYVAPENYTGSNCVEFPLLALYNARNTSTELDIDFTLIPLGTFGMVTVTGHDLRGIASNLSAPHSLQGLTFRVAGPSLKIRFGRPVGSALEFTHPGKVSYVLATGRVVAEFQREWVCALNSTNYATCRPTGRERIVEYVSEVKAYPSDRLMVDAVEGYPEGPRWLTQGFQEELKVLLGLLDFRRVVIPGDKYLSDGKLDPGEGFVVNFWFDSIGYVVPNKEVVTLAGAFLAAVLLNTSTKYSWLAPVLTLSAPTIVCDDGYVAGTIVVITNDGRNSTALYMGVTKGSYVINLGVFKMPVAYVEALPP